MPMEVVAAFNADWCQGLSSRRGQLVGLVFVVASVVGCSNMAQVSGAVSLDGKPLSGGHDLRVTVMFVPEGGSGRTVAALADANGHYVLTTGASTGIVPGDYLVAITAVQMIRPKDNSAPPGGRRLTPPDYADPKRSGFRAAVAPGSNTFDFDLNSGAKVRS